MSSRAGGSRHRGRELALQALYAVDLGLRRAPRPQEVRSVDLDAAPELVAETLVAAASEAEPEDVPGVEVGEDAARAVFDGIAAHFEVPAGARDFAWALVAGACARAAELDERIAARARNWRISRMAAVDRNVLRLGAYEIVFTETPSAVAIDEAVELARRYGSDASPAFVNGILDALAAAEGEA